MQLKKEKRNRVISQNNRQCNLIALKEKHIFYYFFINHKKFEFQQKFKISKILNFYVTIVTSKFEQGQGFKL